MSTAVDINARIWIKRVYKSFTISNTKLEYTTNQVQGFFEFTYSLFSPHELQPTVTKPFAHLENTLCLNNRWRLQVGADLPPQHCQALVSNTGLKNVKGDSKSAHIGLQCLEWAKKLCCQTWFYFIFSFWFCQLNIF